MNTHPKDDLERTIAEALSGNGCGCVVDGPLCDQCASDAAVVVAAIRDLPPKHMAQLIEGRVWRNSGAPPHIAPRERVVGPWIEDQVNPVSTCARCGEAAQGFATIGPLRYCHGDQEQPTCYMQQNWDNMREQIALDNMLGIDRDDPLQQRADELVVIRPYLIDLVAWLHAPDKTDEQIERCVDAYTAWALDPERPCPHNERWVDCRGKCGRPLR